MLRLLSGVTEQPSVVQPRKEGKTPWEPAVLVHERGWPVRALGASGQ